MMLLTILLFLVGFFILVKGADILVKGASSLAHKLGISPWVIGLTIVGIGTSIPEFSIAFISHLLKETEIGLGTIIGSNTFNILFIVGLSALVAPLAIIRKLATHQLIFNILAVFVVLFFAIDGVYLAEGLVLIALFAFWIYFTSRDVSKESGGGDGFPTFTVPASIGFILAGLLGVVLGAQWVVGGVVAIAKAIGASETLISLTAVAIGTSVPELTVSVVAAFRRNAGISLGNVIGSNIFDFLAIIGINSLIRPILFTPDLYVNALITFSAALLLFILVKYGRQAVISRSEGLLMIGLYISYLAYLVML